MTIDGKNVIDMIQNNEIVDNKDYAGALGPDNEPQLKEQLKIAGELSGTSTELTVPVKDAKGKPTGKTTTIHVERVMWSLTDPRGVKASAKWMAKMIGEHPDLLEFEIWNWKGERVRVPSKMSVADLLDPVKLGKPLE